MAEFDASKVLKQIEFYFSDSNIYRDPFLRNKTNESNDKMVDIAVLCTFSRMRSLLSLSTREAKGVPNVTVKGVADALEKSESLRVDKSRSRVGRSEALRDLADVEREVEQRSLYASPFPFDSTLDGLSSFFSTIAPVRSVRLRRHEASKDFKGSIFVEFNSEEDANDVVNRHIEHAGAPLSLMHKREFIDSKKRKKKRKKDEEDTHKQTKEKKASGEETESNPVVAAD